MVLPAARRLRDDAGQLMPHDTGVFEKEMSPLEDVEVGAANADRPDATMKRRAAGRLPHPRSGGGGPCEAWWRGPENGSSLARPPPPPPRGPPPPPWGGSTPAPRLHSRPPPPRRRHRPP